MSSLPRNRALPTKVEAAIWATLETIGSGPAIFTVQTPEPRASGQSAAESLVHSAAHVLGDKGPGALRDFDEFPAPLYATDEKGKILYFNPACVDFAGRTPTLDSDRWCVSWKLYSETGVFIPHDECPMALAVRSHLVVRGTKAVAERPNGSRANFLPFPTPLDSEDGTPLGAVNMLVDLSERYQAISEKAGAIGLEAWHRIVIERVLGSLSIDELKTLVDEIQNEAMRGTPRLLN